ncbi:hypothetical protein M080_1682 [Bacteroides fragilis str. 3397 T10]|nr:hypothetical protein M080_1682 [Bacteroides fragilis str. 3397 T10]
MLPQVLGYYSDKVAEEILPLFFVQSPFACMDQIILRVEVVCFYPYTIQEKQTYLLLPSLLLFCFVRWDII